MLIYLVGQAKFLAPVLLGISVLTFATLNLIPGDPAEIAVRERMEGELPAPEAVRAFRREVGLDHPLALQFSRWLAAVLRGDLGVSYQTGEPVVRRLLDRLPATLELAGASFLLSLAIAVPVGLVAAVKRDSLTDHLSMIAALIGVSTPNFWTGLLLMLLFSRTFGVLPVAGQESIAHVVLPAVTLALPSAAMIARLLRASTVEILGQDYIRTARAKGVPEMSLVLRHALRNAAIPVVTAAGLTLLHFLEGAVVVETIFAWPGVGSLVVEAIFARDFPMVQGCVLMFALSTVVVNLAVDLGYRVTDPRVTFSGGLGDL